ncbi:MAG TPA: hypothetical protein VMU83_07115 [Hanamia sp.]|nr:hypothetical protein [Hanamia sp.]
MPHLHWTWDDKINGHKAQTWIAFLSNDEKDAANSGFIEVSFPN